MCRIFNAKNYDELVQQLNSTDVENLHRSFDFLKEITIKLLTNFLILNGGAVVVTLTFVGTLINGPNSMLVSSFVGPLLCFSIASAIAVILCGVTYWAQSFYTTANSIKVGINESYRFLFLNQQKREFYTNLSSVQNEAENSLRANLLKSIDESDKQFEDRVKQQKKDFEYNNSKGAKYRGIAVILFVFGVGLFFLGVYLMVCIFGAFNNIS